MNPPTCRLCNAAHWPRNGCKWSNAAPRTDGNAAIDDGEIVRLKRDLAAANRKVADLQAVIADQRIRIDSDAVTIAALHADVTTLQTGVHVTPVTPVTESVTPRVTASGNKSRAEYMRQRRAAQRT